MLLKHRTVNDSLLAMRYFQLTEKYLAFNPDSAILVGLEGVEWTKRKRLAKYEALLHDKISTAYSRIGNYPAAMEYTLESLKLSQILDDSRLLAINYETLGTLYTDLLNDSLGFSSYTKALAISQKFGYDDITAWIYNDMGQYYAQKKAYDKAIEYYEKMKPFPDKLKDKYMESLININLGSIYFETGDNEKSLNYLRKSLHISEKINDFRIMAASLTIMAKVYFKSGQQDKGIQLSREALEKASVVKNIQFISAASDNLYQYYNAQKDYKKALEYYQVKQSVYDSAFSKKRLTDFNNLIFRSEINSKQNAINVLTKEKESSRLRFIFSIVLLIFILSALFLLYSSRKRIKNINILLNLKNEEIAQQTEMLRKVNTEIEEKIEQRTRDLELEKRRSLNAILLGQESERERISKDLHDTLSINLIGIKRAIEAFDKEAENNIIEEIDAIIGQVREISHNLNPYSLKSLGLIKAIDDLCYSLKQRHMIDVGFSRINIDSESRLDSHIETEIFRIIQEVFANIIKHADAKNVYMEIIGDLNRIMLTIEDDGKGFNMEKVENYGIGLKNIYTRVTLLGGSINYDTAPGKGTIVLINIPTNQNYD